MSDLAVSASVEVTAPPDQIFDFIARPSNHPIISGDGTVRATRHGPEVLTAVGDKFGMSMKAGIPYRMTNTVVEYEQGRAIAWHNWGKDVWRWEIEPGANGGARVTETYDMTHSVLTWLLKRFGFPEAQRKNLEQSLGNVASHFAAQPADGDA